VKRISLYLMAVFYITAGINHLINPESYRKIIPPWIPLQENLIIISGIAEIFFALLLIFPLTRRVTAWCIIAFLVAVFPANIQMMLNYLRENNSGLWLSMLRLPFQIVLIWWAYSFTKPPA
jgi:uncharacterized membrane protein